jgi:Carboxypeptidase regulatory-like domain
MGVGSKDVGRWAVAVLSCIVLLLVLAPGAPAAESTGQITGTVTKAGMEPLEGPIEVCAFVTGGELEESYAEHCTTTGAGGDYTISELPAGEYDVEFAVPLESSLNYITQYYKDKPSFAEAQPVPVGVGATSGIDAEMQEGGSIKGTVTEFTESKDTIPLGNIEVTAYETGETKFPVGSAITDARGEYTIAGLASGNYKVEFSVANESGLNFVTQYFKDKTSLATANPVPVVQGEMIEGINAELRVGGEISGTVTDAWTRAPVSNVYVFAVGSGETIAGLALTDENGQYTMLGLASGVYRIEFIKLGSGSPYITQYYDEESSLASANPVTASEGSMTPGIDAVLVRKAPVNTVAPVVSGAVAVGRPLSCATGTWTGSPTLAYTYAWLRNGSAIAGATASAYVVQAADQGTELACKVTATNKSGSAGAVSNTLTVPAAPPPAAPRPEVKLLSARIAVSRSSASVPIACAKASCAGTVELTEQIVLRRRRRGRTRFRRETVLLGRASYALNAGQSATIFVHLTRAVRRELARTRRHRLAGTVRVSVTGGTSIRESVLLSEPMRRRRR